MSSPYSLTRKAHPSFTEKDASFEEYRLATAQQIEEDIQRMVSESWKETALNEEELSTDVVGVLKYHYQGFAKFCYLSDYNKKFFKNLDLYYGEIVSEIYVRFRNDALQMLPRLHFQLEDLTKFMPKLDRDVIVYMRQRVYVLPNAMKLPDYTPPNPDNLDMPPRELTDAFIHENTESTKSFGFVSASLSKKFIRVSDVDAGFMIQVVIKKGSRMIPLMMKFSEPIWIPGIENRWTETEQEFALAIIEESSKIYNSDYHVLLPPGQWNLISKEQRRYISFEYRNDY